MLCSMMAQLDGSSGMLPMTWKTCLSSQRLLGSRASIGATTRDVGSGITSVESRHGSYSINPFKVKAIRSDKDEPRFPPQQQEKQPGKEYLTNPLPQFSNPCYKPAGKLDGKVALVVGGDSGIGRAVCYALAREGATIAFTYVKGDEDIDANDSLNIINESKTSDSGDPIAIPADLRYDKNCKDVVDQVIEKYGRIDVLVNNAAVQFNMASLDDITEERLERVFRTNIFSYFFLSRHAVKHMKKGSSIINTASQLAYTGSPVWLDYCSTKGAVVSFTRGLALKLVEKGIRVNGVAPGPTWTPLESAALTDEQLAVFGSKFGSNVPMDRTAQPYEIAPSYVFLASDDSSYFTGQFMHPNGGVMVGS